MSKLSYEELRRRNLEDNRNILNQLGIALQRSNLSDGVSKVVNFGLKRKADGESADVPKKRSKKNYVINTPGSNVSESELFGSFLTESGGRRRSGRILGKEAPSREEIKNGIRQLLDEEIEEEDGENRARHSRFAKDRPMVYGAIPGVEVGTSWLTRMEANEAGIHRPTVAGIHGGPEGTYSIALSGGYEDDIDLGECFTYTGEGGRDLKGTKSNPKNLRTAAQSKDQILSRGNLSLVRSQETGLPVRVVRGYKLKSEFAPSEGYRYDGLYKVEKWWYTTGLSGFSVYKFALSRLPDQAPPPWCCETPSDELHPCQENLTKVEAGVADENGNINAKKEVTRHAQDRSDNTSDYGSLVETDVASGEACELSSESGTKLAETAYKDDDPAPAKDSVALA